VGVEVKLSGAPLCRLSGERSTIFLQVLGQRGEPSASGANCSKASATEAKAEAIRIVLEVRRPEAIEPAP
jgi:hypothetical protein